MKLQNQVYANNQEKSTDEMFQDIQRQNKEIDDKFMSVKEELSILKHSSHILIEQYFSKISQKLDFKQIIKEDIPELQELLKYSKKDPIKLEKLFNGKANQINFKISDANIAMQVKVELENRIKDIQMKVLAPLQVQPQFQDIKPQIIQQQQIKPLQKNIELVKQENQEKEKNVEKMYFEISSSEEPSLKKESIEIKLRPAEEIKQQNSHKQMNNNRKLKRQVLSDSSRLSFSDQEFSDEASVKKRGAKQIEKRNLRSQVKDQSDFQLKLVFTPKNVILEGLDENCFNYSLFFFENYNTIRYLTFDVDWSKGVIGQIFDNNYKKHRDTFGIIDHQFTQAQSLQQMRLQLAFGIDQSFIEPTLYKQDNSNPDQIDNFINLEEDEETDIDHSRHHRSFYSIEVFKNEIFIIGGSSTNNHLLNYEMSYDIILKDLQDLEVKYQPHDLSGLNFPRTGHSSFIVDDYLFVIFGQSQTECEYIKLSVKPEDRKFEKIKIEFDTDYEEFEKAIVFKENNNPQSEIIYFIGGSFKQRRSGNNILQLNQIKVIWDQNVKPQGIEVCKVQGVQDFQYKPPKDHQKKCLEFSQRLKSKLYNKDLNIWYFIDDEQQLIIYDVGKKKFHQKCCKVKNGF
ncbi:UNKNOWN [Stylonychia lemnae]|uniref:Kelch motif family protein n=1 Tax=Stylonychia lemnae TaxID=5949 RepID=A0A077ZMT2_STYLE|nr:UNKNOWN [Stylonychia lemnae]|eukprot:CDW71277.1 UNKNOWN [Stylonychia lemnae]